VRERERERECKGVYEHVSARETIGERDGLGPAYNNSLKRFAKYFTFKKQTFSHFV